MGPLLRETLHSPPGRAAPKHDSNHLFSGVGWDGITVRCLQSVGRVCRHHVCAHSALPLVKAGADGSSSDTNNGLLQWYFTFYFANTVAQVQLAKVVRTWPPARARGVEDCRVVQFHMHGSPAQRKSRHAANVCIKSLPNISLQPSLCDEELALVPIVQYSIWFFSKTIQCSVVPALK